MMKKIYLIALMVVSSACFPQNKTNVLNGVFVNNETCDTIEIFATPFNISITFLVKKETTTYSIIEVKENDNIIFVVTNNGPIIKYSYINSYTFIGQAMKDNCGKELNCGKFYERVKKI